MMQNQWRTIKLPLHTVRPFVWDTIQLSAAHPPLDPEESAAITAHLERKVSDVFSSNCTQIAGYVCGPSTTSCVVHLFRVRATLCIL
jgi:hypothetical protein